MDKQKCQHDVNKKDSTILISKRVCMVSPSYRSGVCTVCEGSFKYTKAKGKLVLLEGDACE